MPATFTLGSWRDDAYDPEWDGPEPIHATLVTDGVRVFPAFGHGRNAWQIKAEHYDDLGLEDWA